MTPEDSKAEYRRLLAINGEEPEPRGRRRASREVVHGHPGTAYTKKPRPGQERARQTAERHAEARAARAQKRGPKPTGPVRPPGALACAPELGFPRLADYSIRATTEGYEVFNRNGQLVKPQKKSFAGVTYVQLYMGWDGERRLQKKVVPAQLYLDALEYQCRP